MSGMLTCLHLLLVPLVVAISTGVLQPSDEACADVVGSCILDRPCPEGATCKAGRCVCQPGSCGVGGFGPFLGKCVPVKSNNGGPSQPLLNPESWFLTAEEIMHSRHGDIRGHAGNIAAFTRGNRVHAFAEGQEFFADLYDELITTQAGDSFHGAGWLVGPYWQLRPELDMRGAKNTSFGMVLTEAANRGLEILALFWRNIKPQNDFWTYTEISNFLSLLKDVSQSRGPNASRVEAYMDARCDSPIGSIHQKFFALTRANRQYPKAWIGGLDVAENRWDFFGSNSTFPVRQNSMSSLRNAEAGLSPVQNECCGWHDTQLSIEGPAAVDIVATFVERWNEGSCDLTSVKPFQQHPPIPTQQPAAASQHGALGSAAVQILRTYGCSYARGTGCTSSFAPNGETSIHDGILKAVRAARYFIYIEDQYFYWVEPLYKALREALRERVAHLILLIQWPQEIPGSSTWVWRLWHPLAQEFPHKVHAFYRRGDVYIHSKTKVFDDVWVMSGSANINYRSHTSDPEAVAAVVDEGPRTTTPEGYNVSAWAHDFRCRLFEDNTGIPAAVWHQLSIDDAVQQWHLVASKNDSRIGSFHFDWASPDNIPTYQAWSDVDVVRNLADPDDRCGEERTSVLSYGTQVLV